MKICVGLGNPGSKYERNRHNIGFMAVDEVARDYGFSPWRKKFSAQICEGRIGAHKLVLLKPETFMNLSGQSVGQALQFYKVEPSQVYVFHDELDIAAGRVKIKQGGGHAGHNGLRSIDAHIGKDYWRIRIGIGHPGDKNAVASYVLKDFSKSDQAWIERLLPDMSRHLEQLFEQGSAPFLNAIAMGQEPKAASSKTAKRPTKETQKQADTQPIASGVKPKFYGAVDPHEDTRTPMQKLLDKFS